MVLCYIEEQISRYITTISQLSQQVDNFNASQEAAKQLITAKGRNSNQISS
jgi:hypothetical protein